MVSDVGNPVVVKKDTVEFSASSFRVGTNDMLKDLIKRMPGMEITEDGKVKFNGQEIDKLTVGGRTFFFNDQSTALNNLPASIVDKIRVIDRDSESARATGVQDTQREKVLDVALKKEYEKGWFGNVGLNAGATLVPKNEEDKLRDNRGLLYSANALVSAYSEKDQLTLIANGQNVEASEGAIFIRIEGGDMDIDTESLANSYLDRGLSTAAQAGLNFNTSRIKNVETTFGANYKFGDSQSGSRSERTTFQAEGDLVSTQDNGGRRIEHNVGTNLEFQKENGNFWFHVRPSFNYSRADATSTGSSKTLREQLEINRSERFTHSLSSSKSAGIGADGTFRDIGGKKGRSLRLGTNLSYRTSGSDSQENSSLYYIGGEDLRALTYNGNGRSFSNSSSLQYNEPLGEKWSARFNAERLLFHRKPEQLLPAPVWADGALYLCQTILCGPRNGCGRSAQRDLLQELWNRGYGRKGRMGLAGDAQCGLCVFQGHQPPADIGQHFQRKALREPDASGAEHLGSVPDERG